MIGFRVAAFLAGFALVGWTVLSAVRTFVLPRAAPVSLTRIVFVSSRWVFGLVIGRFREFASKDRLMALYAPLTLLLLPSVWLILVGAGYAAMFWGLGARTIRDAIDYSGSSLFTLGFARPPGFASHLLSFTAAGLGIALLALLITYLPSIYAAFSRREQMVAKLEVRAGDPPTAVGMILRLHWIRWVEDYDELWPEWENWFVDLTETHTSLASLPFFRSPQPSHHWVVAAGTILDSASLASAVLDRPIMPRAHLCIRAGYIALRSVCDFFGIHYPHDPKPTDPISISRQEFDEAWDALWAAGVPLKQDREQAWRDFSGWRVNYDAPLLALAALTMAPSAPWSSDRASEYRRPRLARPRPPGRNRG
ncbi:MAG TPA: hypothetical protein VNE62_07000 [Actinomycetota bacterium]|nr:hypothetical protein [Actinomycetota bacterium]